VRSSYKAGEFYIAGLLRQRKALEAAASKSETATHALGESNNI
jgi:hypothetical protein